MLSKTLNALEKCVEELGEAMDKMSILKGFYLATLSDPAQLFVMRYFIVVEEDNPLHFSKFNAELREQCLQNCLDLTGTTTCSWDLTSFVVMLKVVKVMRQLSMRLMHESQLSNRHY